MAHSDKGMFFVPNGPQDEMTQIMLEHMFEAEADIDCEELEKEIERLNKYRKSLILSFLCLPIVVPFKALWSFKTRDWKWISATKNNIKILFGSNFDAMKGYYEKRMLVYRQEQDGSNTSQ